MSVRYSKRNKSGLDLDDSMVLHYNLATKQQTVSSTLPTDAADGRFNTPQEDAGNDGK